MVNPGAGWKGQQVYQNSILHDDTCSPCFQVDILATSQLPLRTRPGCSPLLGTLTSALERNLGLRKGAIVTFNSENTHTIECRYSWLLQQNSLVVQIWASFWFSSRKLMMPSLWDPVFSWKNSIRAMLEGHPVLILMVRLMNYICTLSMLLSSCLALTAESSFMGYSWLSVINDDPCQAKVWNICVFRGRHYLL